MIPLTLQNRSVMITDINPKTKHCGISVIVYQTPTDFIPPQDLISKKVIAAFEYLKVEGFIENTNDRWQCEIDAIIKPY